MEHSQSIGRYISCIHRNFHIYLHKNLESFNLGPGQFHFLMMLYYHDGVNQEALADQLHIDKATVARAIKKLEETGYVTRKKDPQDHRSYALFLTQKAIKLRPTIKTILKQWTQQLLTDINEDEQELLYGLLERITKNAIEKNQKD